MYPCKWSFQVPKVKLEGEGHDIPKMKLKGKGHEIPKVNLKYSIKGMRIQSEDSLCSLYTITSTRLLTVLFRADFSQSFCPSKNLELKGQKIATRLKTGNFYTNPSMKRLKKKQINKDKPKDVDM
jgi:hypothetical protein